MHQPSKAHQEVGVMRQWFQSQHHCVPGRLVGTHIPQAPSASGLLLGGEGARSFVLESTRQSCFVIIARIASFNATNSIHKSTRYTLMNFFGEETTYKGSLMCLNAASYGR
jgi:hypothetical protein